MSPFLHATALHVIETYKYLGLYISLALGIVGLPIPDETIMTFAGFLVYQGRLSFLLTIGASIGGSLTGMSISYFVGNKIGLPVIKKFGKYFHITPEKLEKAEGWFRRYRGKSIIFGYFVPGLRHLTAYFAGISEIGYGTFLSLAALGGTVWVLTFVSLGRLLGKDWKVFALMLHRYVWLLVFLGVFAVAMYYLLKDESPES